ncbi:MAG TPA: hypothetical protein VNT02_11195 [Burkholderiales bacterium]|nr:hypothetical protein [Burkholderiales bacterium]
MLLRLVSFLALLAAASGLAFADDRADYNRRGAERDVALFSALDRDADGVLTRAEVQADLTLGPRFDDADINRDGLLTREEMQRYIERRYGVELTVPGARTSR